MEDGVIVVKAKLDTKDFTKEIQQTEAQLQELEKYYKAALDPKAKEDPRAIKNLEVEIEKTKNKLVGLYKQQQKIDQEGFKNVPLDVSNIGNETEKLIKKVGKLALAVFSVRSAYMFVRQSVSTLSSYNENMQKQIEGIRLALANVLAPVIQWIVNLAQTLIQYLDYIIERWFGFSIISNANAMNMNKASKSAKELKKTLAGFDEVNMVSENKSDGGGGTSATLPSKLSQGQIPDWLKWIGDNKDTFMLLLEVLGIIKAGQWLANLGLLSAGLGGIVGIIGGVVITYLCAKQVWEDLKKLKEDLEEIREKMQDAHQKWIKNETDINRLTDTGNVNRKAGLEALEKMEDVSSRIFGLSKDYLANAVKVSENTGKQIQQEVEIYKTKGATKEEQDKIKQGIIEQYLYNLKVIEKLEQEGEDTTHIKELNADLLDNYADMGGKVEIVKDELNKVSQVKFDKKTIDIDVNTKNADKSMDSWWTKISKKMGFYIGTSDGGSTGTGGKGAKGLVYGNIPKLAMGGLINNPGAGVPYRGSIIGERGPEAVLPLTQTDQMQLLGQAIGKWITINAEVINNMNGRVISRELIKIQNQDNFSNNI